MIKNFLMIVLVFIFASCEDAFDCFKSTGKTITENRDIDTYTKINLEDDVKLQIEYGAINRLSVTAGENLIDEIKTKVVDNTLYITNENTCNWVRSFKNEYIVNVTLDTLLLITYGGVGDINFINELELDSFRMEVYGGWGTVNLNYNGDYLRLIHHTGGVDFNVKGRADDFYMYFADNGIADCSQLQTRLNHVWSLGTGNCRINVSDNLKARISYHGNIYYQGDPAVIETMLESSGQLIKE